MICLNYSFQGVHGLFTVNEVLVLTSEMLRSSKAYDGELSTDA